jgi:hypothetical protein
MRKFLTFAFLLLQISSYAQVEISAGMGAGWFGMHDLKDFQESLQHSYPVDTKITEQFPVFFIYDVAIYGRVGGSNFVGFYYQYGSTGGRIHYQDFSGEITSDQLIHYNTLGLTLGGELSLAKNFLLRVDLHPGATFSNLDFNEVVKVGNEVSRASFKFHSINATFQPTIELHKVWGQFATKVFAGFHLPAYSGKLKYEENKNSYLTGGGNDPIVADWTGLRLGLSGIYIISRKK